MTGERRVAMISDAAGYVGPSLARLLAPRHDLVVGDPEDGLVADLSRRELGCLDDGRHGSPQGLDLAHCAVVCSVHDRQYALDVDAAHRIGRRERR